MTSSSIGKILIVDDEVELKNILVEALASQGYESVGFTSGEDALTALRGEAFDILLTDLMMPGMDGITLVKKGLEIDPHLVPIMMTGQGTIQTAVDAMKVGAFDYVLKPFRLQKVSPVLTRAMNTRHVRLENLQLRETVAIYELAQTVAFTLDPQTILSKLADAALQQTDADEVSVLLPLGNGSDELYVAAVRGEKRERLLGERVPLDESISGWVARQREPQMLEGHVNDARFRSLWPRPEITSAISIPMQVAGKLVGTLNLNALSRPRPFTLGQLKALTILAGTAAAALESATLYTQVRKAEANYRSIFENSIGGIFQASHEARFLSANPAMARILGYDSSADLICSISNIDRQVFVHADKCGEILSRVEAKGSAKDVEVEAYRKDGEKIWLSMNVRAGITEAGENYCEGMIEDITERKRTEAERQAMFEISQAVGTSADLPSLLKLIHQAIQKVVYAENCFVALHKEHADTLEMQFFVDKYDEFPPPQKMGKSCAAHVFRTGEPSLINQDAFDQLESAGKVDLVGKPSPSWVGVPLKSPAKALGVMVVQHYEDEGAYSQRDVEFLASVGGQIAVAIERKQAEQALRESEDRLRTIFEGTQALLTTVNPTGHFTYVNEAVAQAVGLGSPQDLIGKSYLHFIHPEDRPRVLETFTEQARMHRPSTLQEFRIVDTAGNVKWFSFLSTLAIKDGELVGQTGVAQNITERRWADEQLRLSEEKYRTILEGMEEGYAEVDLRGTYVFVNDAFCRITGRSRDEVLDTNYKEIFDRKHQKLLYDAYHKVYLTGEAIQDLAYEVTRKDGAKRLVEESVKLRTDAAGNPIGFTGIRRDCTDRKQAENALRESEEKYRTILESITDSYYEIDLSGNLTFFNSALVRLLGYSPEELMGMNNRDYADPEHAKRGFQALQEMYATGAEVTELDWELIRKDGTRRYVEASATLRHDAAGTIIGFRGVARDVTERKQAEDALRESEERYRDLVENAQDIIYTHDLKGNYISSNKAGEEITGYSLEESLKLNLQQTIAPEYLEKAREMLARKLAGEDITAYELELIAKDGHRVPIEVNTRLVMQDGIPVGINGIARDITQRKAAEAELRRLAAAVEQTADSIVITDTEGTIEYVNPAFERITGYSKQEAVGKNPRILKSEKTDPSIYQDLWKTILSGGVWKGQLVNRKKDGTDFYERVTISAIHDESGKIVNYIAVKQDTTAQMQLEEQLRQSQKLEAIGQLAGGVAHDFNNLLTVIGGYSSILLTKLPQDSPHRSNVEEIKKASDRAGALTRQLLAFSRKQILQPKILDLNVAVADLEKMLRRLIGEDIDLLTILSPGLGKVKADPGQMEQVLLNLIVNARDAMPRGGKLTIETSNVMQSPEYAERHVTLPGPYVMLAVTDNGCGMPAEIQSRIFEPFFTTKESGKGTGLGLATVYGIIKQSGGNIWVYSEKDRGTTIKVFLPRVDEVIHHEDSGPLGAIPHGTETVLVVEDEDQVRAILTQILEGQGYRVVSASNGEQALSISRDREVDISLMITDVVMPQMSGRELAGLVSKVRPDLPVLFMSGYTDDAIVRHGLLDEKLNFIQKPFDSAGVARKVREVLDSPQA